MKAFLHSLRLVVLLAALAINSAFADRAGFYMPDSLEEFSLSYETYDNLIVLPLTINNGLKVNLILDTGCRNLVLFGKSFADQFTFLPDKTISFSGMGNGSSLNGSLALNNTVELGSITGSGIPIVVVPDRSIFKRFPRVDGIIGYEIFARFEVEIRPGERRITFRPALLTNKPKGFDIIPLTIEESRPMVRSALMIDGEERVTDLLIDTGSSQAILIKSKDPRVTSRHRHQVLGRGLNGNIDGWSTTDSRLTIGGHVMAGMKAGVIYSQWYDYASIGMGALKEYIIVLNYAQSYAALKRVA